MSARAAAHSAAEDAVRIFIPDISKLMVMED